MRHSAGPVKIIFLKNTVNEELFTHENQNLSENIKSARCGSPHRPSTPPPQLSKPEALLPAGTAENTRLPLLPTPTRVAVTHREGQEPASVLPANPVLWKQLRDLGLFSGNLHS